MRPARSWDLEPILGFFAWLTIAYAAAALLLKGIFRWSGLPETDRPIWSFALGTGLFHGATLLLLNKLVRAHQWTWREAFGLFADQWPRRWLFAAIVTIPALGIAWIVQLSCRWILERAGVPHDDQTAVLAVRNATRLWERILLLGFSVVSAPVIEELIFRGVLWRLFRDRGWWWAGYLGVSMMFALIHANIGALLALWMLGMFWTWLYETGDDLTAPMLSHALFNLINYLWLALSGA